MIDAGAGTLFGPVAGNLSKALEEVGVMNNDISNIIATHLHPDHIGGMISESGNKIFENAALTLTQDEYSFWNKEENFKSNPEDQNLPLNVLSAYSGNINLISGEEDLGLGLTAIDLPGHTAGHIGCLLYTSPSPRDAHESRMPSSA